MGWETVLRRAEPGDELAVAEVHVRSWQVGYENLLPSDYLDQLRPADRAKGYLFGEHDPAGPDTTLAEHGGRVVGFATIGPELGRPGSDTGQLYALYVDPEHWGRGIGKALIADAYHRFRLRGAKHAVLWVLVGNERAERFYRADGWHSDGLRSTEEVHGISIDMVRYQRDLRA